MPDKCIERCGIQEFIWLVAKCGLAPAQCRQEEELSGWNDPLMRDFEALFGGDEAAVARALEEARMDRRLAEARAQLAAGKAILADGVFFDKMRRKIRAKYALE